MKTFNATNETVTREWLLVDATDMPLGRLASEIARRLRGKHKAIYTPHIDTGDYIVVINAEKIAISGNKADKKKYYRHTEYPGGLRVTAYKDMLADHPERILESAVKGMLPKNRLGRQMYRKLRVYQGTEHNHEAQQPRKVELCKPIAAAA